MNSADLKNILSGSIDGMPVTQEFLLSFAIVMEIPMIMILLSKLLSYKFNRIAQIIASLFLILIQAWSLTVGKVTLHYWFFSLVEIGLMIFILLQALNWKRQADQPRFTA